MCKTQVAVLAACDYSLVLATACKLLQFVTVSSANLTKCILNMVIADFSRRLQVRFRVHMVCTDDVAAAHIHT